MQAGSSWNVSSFLEIKLREIIFQNEKGTADARVHCKRLLSEVEIILKVSHLWLQLGKWKINRSWEPLNRNKHCALVASTSKERKVRSYFAEFDIGPFVCQVCVCASKRRGDRTESCPINHLSGSHLFVSSHNFCPSNTPELPIPISHLSIMQLQSLSSCWSIHFYQFSLLPVIGAVNSFS